MKMKGILKHLATLTVMAALVLCLLPLGADAVEYTSPTCSYSGSITEDRDNWECKFVFENGFEIETSGIGCSINGGIAHRHEYTLDPGSVKLVQNGSELTFSMSYSFVCNGKTYSDSITTTYNGFSCATTYNPEFWWFTSGKPTDGYERTTVMFWLRREATPHSGTATCQDAANCTVCGTSYKADHEFKEGAMQCTNCREECSHSFKYEQIVPNVIRETCEGPCGIVRTATLPAITGEFTYNGTEHKPLNSNHVIYADAEGETYFDGSFGSIKNPIKLEVKYSDNTNAGENTAKAFIEIEGVKAEQSFTIEPASLDGAVLKLAQEEFVYDGYDHKPAVTVELAGFPNLTEGTDYTLLYLQCRRMVNGEPAEWFGNASGSCIDAGEYYAVIQGKGNFTTTSKLGIYKAYTVKKATPSPDHFAFTPPSKLTYGDSFKKAEVKPNGVDGMGEITVRYSSDMSAGLPTDAGTYQVYITTAGGDNFVPTENPLTSSHWTFTIEPKEITASDFSVQEVTYNGKEQKPKVNSRLTEGTDYVISWDDLSFENAKDYTARIEGKGNYSGSVAVTYKIKPKSVSVSGITADDKVYDGTTNAALDCSRAVFDGIIEGDDLGVNATGNFEDANVGEGKSVTIGGLTLTGDAAKNYVLAENGQQTETTATITPKSVTATITVPEGNVYGNVKAPEVTLDGLLDMDTDAVVLTYDGETNSYEDSHYNSTVMPTEAGKYTVSVSVNNNYALTGTTKAKFNIAKAPAVYTPPKAKELTYNGEAQELLTAGKVEYNNNKIEYYIHVEDPWQEAIPKATDAGIYTVTWAFLENENYLGATGKVDVTIKPATITVTPDAGQTMVYGDSVPTLTYTSSGHIGNEVPAFAGTLGISGTDAGSQQITQGTLKLVDNGNFKASNYELTLAPAALTVNQASLTVNVQNQTVKQGQQVDQSKYEVRGLAAGDTATVTLTASTDQVTVNGIIEAEVTVTNASGTDVTDCYSIACGYGELTVAPDTAKIDALTEQNVTSASEADIQAVLERITAAGEEAQAEFADVTEKCEKLLEKIDAVEKKNEELKEKAEAYNPATVNYAQQEEIQDLMKELEEQMASENLTEAERKELDLALENLEAADKRIEDSLKILATEEIRDTLDVTAENVKPVQKQDIEKAIETIEDALKTYGGNYTASDKEDLEEQIENLKAAQAVLEKAESAQKIMNDLPKTADPDDEAALKAYADAKAAYNGLGEYEKSLVSKDAKQKLDGLYAALTNYKIIKGNGGRWVDGSTKTLSFTANGPYSKFTGLKVDGKTVDPKDYTAVAGSTVITLKASYLDTLSVGKHTIRVEYTDGYVDGSFRVRSSAVPATGDNANLLLWTGLLLVGTASTAVLINQGRKRKW